MSSICATGRDGCRSIRSRPTLPIRPQRRTSARSSKKSVRSTGRKIAPCSWRGRPVRARELEEGSGCLRPGPWAKATTQELRRVQRMIGIDWTAQIQTSNRLQIGMGSERRRDCFGSRANESHSCRSVGGRWASNPSTWAKFLVRAVAAEPSREKRRRKGWLPLAPAAQPRVRRRLPRVPRALAARPPRGRRAGQGRRQAQGH